MNDVRKMLSDAVIEYNAALTELERTNIMIRNGDRYNRKTAALMRYCKAKAYLEGIVDCCNLIHDDYLVVITYRSEYEFDQPIIKYEILKVRK